MLHLLQDSLASDDRDGAARAAGEALDALSAVDMGLLSGEAHKIWMNNSDEIETALNRVKQAQAIEPMRVGFETLSNALIVTSERFGGYKSRTLYRMHCPMAFNNKGADWLQKDKDLRNPYFSAAMPKCGQVVGVIGNEIK